jgi:hypothetical protein
VRSRDRAAALRRVSWPPLWPPLRIDMDDVRAKIAEAQAAG